MIHQFDIGAVIRITPATDEDINSAVSAQIRYRKPSKIVGFWEATIVNGALEYVTQENDIDEAGEWFFQGYVDLVSWAGSTTVVKSKIGAALVE